MNTKVATKPIPWKKLILSTVITAIVLYILVGIPMPYVFKMPGRPISADKVVHVKGGNKNHKGKFFITTVIIERANVYFYLYHFIDNQSALIPLAQYDGSTGVMAESEPGSEEILLDESMYRAKVFALRKAGYDVPLEYDGVQMTHEMPVEVARNPLQPGDVITAIDGVKMEYSRQINNYLNRVAPDKKDYAVTFVRNGAVQTVRIPPLHDRKGQNFIGMYFQTHLKRNPLPVEITIDTDKFEGSSAGMAVFLEILHQLKSEDLADGKRIACSGTLGDLGYFHPVQGVDFKVPGAEKIGCQYFLCARQNVNDAMRKSSFIRVIPVLNIDHCLYILDNLDNPDLKLDAPPPVKPQAEKTNPVPSPSTGE